MAQLVRLIEHMKTLKCSFDMFVQPLIQLERSMREFERTFTMAQTVNALEAPAHEIIEWDINRPGQCHNAAQRYLMLDQYGYEPYSITPGGQRGDKLAEFDMDAGKLWMEVSEEKMKAIQAAAKARDETDQYHFGSKSSYFVDTSVRGDRYITFNSSHQAASSGPSVYVRPELTPDQLAYYRRNYDDAVARYQDRPDIEVRAEVNRQGQLVGHSLHPRLTAGPVANWTVPAPDYRALPDAPEAIIPPYNEPPVIPPEEAEQIIERVRQASVSPATDEEHKAYEMLEALAAEQKKGREELARLRGEKPVTKRGWRLRKGR